MKKLVKKLTICAVKARGWPGSRAGGCPESGGYGVRPGLGWPGSGPILSYPLLAAGLLLPALPRTPKTSGAERGRSPGWVYTIPLVMPKALDGPGIGPFLAKILTIEPFDPKMVKKPQKPAYAATPCVARRHLLDPKLTKFGPKLARVTEPVTNRSKNGLKPKIAQK